MYTLRNGIDRTLNSNSIEKPSATHRIKFFEQRKIVYNFFQRPHGFLSVTYQIFVCSIVLICLILNVLSTVEDYEKMALKGLRYLDILMVFVFGLEFIARFWSSPFLAKYRNCDGRIRFLCNPFNIFDIIAIITSAIVIFIDIPGQILSTLLKGFRLFKVFGMFKLNKKFSPWKLMGSVVWDQREHLCITAYLGFLAFLIISFVVYFAEKDVNPDFRSIADSMWWSVVTLCTVGYGDITPITTIGKFLSCICIILGVSIFALPAGILGTGLALKVEEQQNKRQIGKHKQPAAKLIQDLWRLHLVTKDCVSSAIWKGYMMANSEHKFLTKKQKNALKFIMMVKFLVTKRRFTSSFKPYEIKDVLEQYTAGHTEVLAEVRQLQTQINTIHSVVKSNYENLQDLRVIMNSHQLKTDNIDSAHNHDFRSNFREINKNIDKQNNKTISKLSAFRRNSYL